MPGGDPCPGQFCDEGGNVCTECQVDGDCDDSNSCTIDTCNAGTCDNAADTGTGCDDGEGCTTNDTCASVFPLGSYECDPAVPTDSETWGGVKSLYR